MISVNKIRDTISRLIGPSNIVRNDILNITQNRVISGPFRGMQFYSEYFPSKYLLGTYELELSSLINRLSKNKFRTIIDVGAELGYYAVGLAIKNPKARIIAFERYKDWRLVISQQAKKNGVEHRVIIKGVCTLDTLAASLENCGKCLIFSDCEGGEKTLLDPEKIPALKKCSLLIELHEFKYPDLASIIEKRFEKSHKIIKISSRERTISDLPKKFQGSLKSLLLEKYYLGSMDEKRNASSRWYYLEVK